MSARYVCLVCWGLVFFATPLQAEDVKVLELRLQQSGESTFFHVRLEARADLQAGLAPNARFGWMVSSRVPALRQAKLVPQDGQTQSVFRRGGEEWARSARGGVPVEADLPRPERSPDGAQRTGP